MLLRWVINFQFLKAKTPSQANRLFEWALLRQLCDHKASESTGIIMLLTLSTVVCSQQKWKNNQIDLSMSHVPCTQWSQLIGYGKWCSLWQHAHIISTGRPKLGYFETWPVFSLPTQWKNMFETVERKKLKIQKNSLFFRVRWRHCENILFHVQAFLTFNRSGNKRF